MHLLIIAVFLQNVLLRGSEKLSGPNDLIEHDNTNGLNDLNSLFGLKKNQKLLAPYILSDIPGIRILSNLNDLSGLNNLRGLNGLNSLISSKNLLNLMFSSTLAPKWPNLVSQSSKIHYFIDFWPSFRTEDVEDRDVTFN